MLTIGKLGAPDQLAYYEQQVADGLEDYFGLGAGSALTAPRFGEPFRVAPATIDPASTSNVDMRCAECSDLA